MRIKKASRKDLISFHFSYIVLESKNVNYTYSSKRDSIPILNRQRSIDRNDNFIFGMCRQIIYLSMLSFSFLTQSKQKTTTNTFLFVGFNSSLGNYGNKLPSIEEREREKNVNKMRIDKRENLRESSNYGLLQNNNNNKKKKAKKSRSIRKIQSNR